MNNPEDRYNKTYQYKDVEFYLSEYLPNQEECRIIILKIAEQASRDYISLYHAESVTLQCTWETARDFIFSDTHLISWGDRRISPAYLLDLIDVDIRWLRRKMAEKLQRFESKKDDQEKE